MFRVSCSRFRAHPPKAGALACHHVCGARARRFSCRLEPEPCGHRLTVQGHRPQPPRHTGSTCATWPASPARDAGRGTRLRGHDWLRRGRRRHRGAPPPVRRGRAEYVRRQCYDVPGLHRFGQCARWRAPTHRVCRRRHRNINPTRALPDITAPHTAVDGLAAARRLRRASNGRQPSTLVHISGANVPEGKQPVAGLVSPASTRVCTGRVDAPLCCATLFSALPPCHHHM